MQYLKNIKHSDIYFFGIILLVVSLPLSVFMMSVSQILLTLNWLLEGNFKQKFNIIVQKRSLWVFSLLYVIHILGLLNTSWPEGFIGDTYNAIKDLRIKLPLLLLPIIVGTSKSFSNQKLKTILLFFTAAVIANSFISTGILFGVGNYEVNDVRDISIFISHIRFALLINTALLSLFWMLMSKSVEVSNFERAIYIVSIFWLILFLFLLQSLTGIGILIICSFVFSLIWAGNIKNVFIKSSLIVLAISIPLISFLYILNFVKDFKEFDIVDKESLDVFTEDGNRYRHDFKNQQVENCHWVGLYICEKELKEEWNKLSNYNYNGKDKKGQLIRYTLIRYLTSIGLRKDAAGVKNLKQDDISMIEAGYANYIFKSSNSLSKRFYQVVWEVDLYLRGGNPSGHSVAQRIEYLKAGRSIISENPLFGVGTGDIQIEFDKQYDKMNSKLNKYSRHRAHNQFVTFIIAFGFIGAIVIIFALFYPPYYEKKYFDFLFIAFLLVAVVSMLNEDTLETQPGVTFFTIFYSLFVFSRQKI